jgi:hypothetical protein
LSEAGEVGEELGDGVTDAVFPATILKTVDYYYHRGAEIKSSMNWY